MLPNEKAAASSVPVSNSKTAAGFFGLQKTCTRRGGAVNGLIGEKTLLRTGATITATILVAWD
jgi:hypothetical protein